KVAGAVRTPLVVARMRPLWVCAAMLAVTYCRAQDTSLVGSIAGEVYTKGADGQREVVPGAHINLHGPVERQAESDAIGRYRFELLPPGKYVVEGTAPGLSGDLTMNLGEREAADVPVCLALTGV